MLDLDLESTCFITFYTKITSKQKSNGKEKYFKTGVINNAYSHIYPYLKDVSTFYLTEYSDSSLNMLRHKLSNFKHIVCSIFYTDILRNPKFIEILDRRFVLGGPGVELATFYRYAEIPDYVTVLPGKCISKEVLGFVSNRFSTYWDRNFASQFDMYTFCVPTNIYFCEKAIKYGPCSFCNYTPLFMKTSVFRKNTRKIDSIIDDVVETFKPARNITMAHLAGQTYNENMLDKLYKCIYNRKNDILKTNLIFVLYSLFTECNKFLDYVTYNNVNHRIAFSISFESFIDQDLILMNKKYFNISYGLDIVKRLLQKGFSFITSVIINHSNALIFDDNYISNYLKNWRKFIEIVNQYCYGDLQFVKVFINPVFISHSQYVNSNLLDEKVRINFNTLISKMISICKNSKIMINFGNFK